MLDPSFLNASVELNQSLAEKGVFIDTIPDTPLGMLVRQTPSLGMTSDTDYATAIKQLVDLSRTEDHAELKARVVQLATESVRQTLNLTRNTVMPHVRRVLDDYNQRLKAIQTAPPAYNTDIIYQPDVYSTGSAREYGERWEGVTLAQEPTDFNFGRYEAEELLELASLTEGEDFNKLLREMLTADNGKALGEIASMLAGERRFSSLPAIYALPVSIIAQNMETPKEGVRASIGTYNLNRSYLSNVAGKAALRIVNRINDNVQTNVLYTGGAGGGTISVNGEVYKRLIDQGLTVEMLIGNEILGRPYYGANLVKPEIMERLQAAYDNDRAIRVEAHTINLRVEGRNALMAALKADQQRIVEAGEFTIEGDSAEKSWGRLKTVVDAIMAVPIMAEDPSTIIAAALCGTWYLHTDSVRILDLMMSIGKNQPNLEPEELGTLTSVRYIAEWVASMIVRGQAGLEAAA